MGRAAYIEGGAELARRVLLERYGVMFRHFYRREPSLPQWRELMEAYRRREVRGGRFGALASGEQFALHEAVGLLRAVRRQRTSAEVVSRSAADPLNLDGTVTPLQGSIIACQRALKCPILCSYCGRLEDAEHRTGAHQGRGGYQSPC